MKTRVVKSPNRPTEVRIEDVRLENHEKFGERLTLEIKAKEWEKPFFINFNARTDGLGTIEIPEKSELYKLIQFMEENGLRDLEELRGRTVIVKKQKIAESSKQEKYFPLVLQPKEGKQSSLSSSCFYHPEKIADLLVPDYFIPFEFVPVCAECYAS